jgi:endoribonuclease Dicer
MEVQKGWPTDFFCHVEPRTHRAALPVSLATLRPALTAACSELTFDYERLEYLGDSFLKMFLTLHFFVLNPRRNEGFLTESRRMVENNAFLRSRATLEDIQGTLMFHKMKRTAWFPPVNESVKRTQFIPNKTVADAVEAIIGACILQSQERGGAIATKRFLGSEFYDDISDYLAIWNQHMDQTDSSQRRRHAERMMRSVRLVEDTIGYRFSNPRYAVEAITHASSLGPNVDGTGDCYERLEFLGMLYYRVWRFMFEHQFRGLCSWLLGLGLFI